MRSTLIISALVVLVYGRPEPPAGYNYPSPPSNRYGAPSGGGGLGGQGDFRSISGQSGFGNGAGAGGNFGGSFATTGTESSSISSFGRSGGSFTDNSQSGGSLAQVGSSSLSSFGSSSGGSLAGGSLSGNTLTQAGAGGSSSFGRSSGGAFSGASSSGGVLVHKHIYVHVAPPEAEEEHQARTPVRVPPPQKHYKIIFIKAPTPPAPTAAQLPPIPQDEEKTLVYVLVKKPEELSEISIPTPAPTQPSKPEVYFIRYKAQKESQGQGVAGQGDGSQDDTVEVGAREGNNQQGGGVSQNSASSGGYSYSSNGSSAKSSSSGVSSQYGPPEARGPY